MKNINYVMFFILGILFTAMLIQPYNVLTGYAVSENNLSNNFSSKASMDIVAVSSEDNRGLIGKLTVEVTPGDGKILVNTDPFLEPDTQLSANIAANVAKDVIGTSLNNKNLVYNFDIKSNFLGGPSAGAAMTVATISALTGKEIRDDIIITGTIKKNGLIGQIGGVMEKAEIASYHHKKIILIPKGQSKLVQYETRTTEDSFSRLRIYKSEYIPKEYDLKKYAKEELNIEIIEVQTIYDVMEIMLKK